MIPQTIHTIVSAATPSREDFAPASYSSPTSSSDTKFSAMNVAVMLITFIILLLLLSLIGYYLWNYVVAGADKGDTGLFTFARKADSIWQIIGLFILTSIFFGGCCPMTS